MLLPASNFLPVTTSAKPNGTLGVTEPLNTVRWPLGHRAVGEGREGIWKEKQKLFSTPTYPFSHT